MPTVSAFSVIAPLISEWSRITGELNVDILVLDMRENIRTRQAKGIALAKVGGIPFECHTTVYTPEFVITY